MDTERSPGEFLFKEEMMINPTQTRAEKEERSLPMQLQANPPSLQSQANALHEHRCKDLW